MEKLLYKYRNGNADVEIYDDGTRVIEFEDDLQLEFPLNIDIRVSNQCSFGQKADGSPGFCTFCHEMAKVNGRECDYEQLLSKLEGLPKGIELSVGSNTFTDGLFDFLKSCKERGYICNVTVNQGHLKRDFDKIKEAICLDYIKGLGISYRSSLKWDIPEELLNYENTVFHVITGIDDIDDVKLLANKGVKKILILGEKDFGYNYGKVDLNSEKHKRWRWFLRGLLDLFDVVSFDNLSLLQLKPERFMSKKHFEEFNQGEHSIYINAVDGYFAPSSRSFQKQDWNTISVSDYFKDLEDYRENV